MDALELEKQIEEMEKSVVLAADTEFESNWTEIIKQVGSCGEKYKSIMKHMYVQGAVYGVRIYLLGPEYDSIPGCHSNHSLRVWCRTSSLLWLFRELLPC